MKTLKILLVILGIFSFESYAGLCRPDVPLHCGAQTYRIEQALERFKGNSKQVEIPLFKEIADLQKRASACSKQTLVNFHRERNRLLSSSTSIPAPQLKSPDFNQPFDRVEFDLKVMQAELNFLKANVTREKQKYLSIDLTNLRRIVNNCKNIKNQKFLYKKPRPEKNWIQKKLK